AARSFRPFTGQIGTYSTVPEAVGLSSVDYPTRDIESLGGRARIGCLLISHMVGDLCQAPVFRSQFGHRFDELTLTSWEPDQYSQYKRLRLLPRRVTSCNHILAHDFSVRILLPPSVTSL